MNEETKSVASLLKSIEFDCDPESSYAACGYCCRKRDDGHDQDCAIGALLAEYDDSIDTAAES